MLHLHIKLLKALYLIQHHRNTELDTINSKGVKFTIAYEGDKTSINLSLDKTDQDNIPPFAQLTNTIPNWSAAFGVGASALTGGLKLWPIELFANSDRQGVAHTMRIHLSYLLLREQA